MVGVKCCSSSQIYIHGNVWDLCRSFLHPLISALRKLQGEPCHSHVRCMQCNTMDVKLIYIYIYIYGDMGIHSINIFTYFDYVIVIEECIYIYCQY